MGKETTPRMTCPDCGVDMNHHAEKLCDPVTPEEAAQVDAELGFLVEEVHACPTCGQVASRRSPSN